MVGTPPQLSPIIVMMIVLSVFRSSGSIGVSFFVDCPTSSWSAIKAQLQLIVSVASFGVYIIDTSFSNVEKVTVGKS